MSFFKVLAIATTSFALLAVPTIAVAKGPSGGKGAGGSKWSTPPGWGQGKKTGWKGGSRPPGWSKGRKTGWRGELMPSGLLRRR